MKNIKLELTIEETNLILNSLSELPFKISNILILNIQKQAQAQLEDIE